MHDVAVIGGGPAGSKVASLLAGEHDVIIVEEHNIPGIPKHCAGLVSEEVIRLSGVRPEILNRFHGANIIFPNGRSMPIKSKDHKAVLIDRVDLDTKMAQAAEDAGAKHMYSSKYVTHKISDDHVNITTSTDTLAASVIVGADGCDSKVAASLANNGPAEYVRGIQVDIKRKCDDEGMINVYIGSQAPGFVAWEITFGDMTKIGLCASWEHGPPSPYLNALLKRLNVNENDIVSKYCGKIPLGLRRTTYAERTLLVGDAAGHVKPISGGGLYPALRASHALAETVTEAFDENTFSEKFLSVYEKRWKRDIGKELKKGYNLRKMYTTVSDAEFNRTYEITDNENIRKMLNSGNIDHPSDLMLKTLAHPVTTLRLLPIMIKAKFRGMR
jgi:geranylgeranyl reductase family protein